MSKKNYEIIARALRFSWARGDLTQVGLNKLAEALGEDFKARTPRFDLGKFLNSCGVYHA